MLSSPIQVFYLLSLIYICTYTHMNTQTFKSRRLTYRMAANTDRYHKLLKFPLCVASFNQVIALYLEVMARTLGVMKICVYI